MKTRRFNTWLLIAALVCGLVLVGCAPSEVTTGASPAPTEAPKGVVTVEAPLMEGVSPCDLSTDQVGQTVRVTGQVGMIDSSDPMGFFTMMEAGGCRAGIWMAKPRWQAWGQEVQSLIKTGQWVTVEGSLKQFQGNLIVEVGDAPPAAAEAPTTPAADTPSPAEEMVRVTPTLGALPEDYQLEVPLVYSGMNEMPALCYLGAFAMVAQYHHPKLTFSDVMAYSGLGSNAIYLDPPAMTAFLSNGLSNVGLIYAAQHLNAPLVAGVGRGGSLSDPFMPAGPALNEQTATVLYFDGADQALAYLKQAVATGHPVMVHIDFYFVYDDFAAVSTHWQTVIGKDHASHFMTVTGYDADTIILNDPTDPTEAAANLPAGVDNFMLAWENAEDIPGMPPIGPYWMLYLAEAGQAPSAEDIIAWNADTARTAPDEIRRFAANPNGDEFTRFNFNELARGRLEFANFLEQNGEPEAAALYRESGERLSALVFQEVILTADVLPIADLEAQALALLGN